MCSPTRAALLTGRNAHRVGNGQIGELANDWDGYTGTYPEEQCHCCRSVKDYGYSHRRLGKVAHASRANFCRGSIRILAYRVRLQYFYGFLGEKRPNGSRNSFEIQSPTSNVPALRMVIITIISAKILPTTQLAGCVDTKLWRLISRSSCIGRVMLSWSVSCPERMGR